MGPCSKSMSKASKPAVASVSATGTLATVTRQTAQVSPPARRARSGLRGSTRLVADGLLVSFTAGGLDEVAHQPDGVVVQHAPAAAPG
jgi:hypothetical protein